ncbi:phage GP46 family protein [Snodgrassella sp. CFCC 13594]|uniref:phage GP46 family protein n=1 Tax=Snodgrassella sp. CFCC 13594 TaxID=1775559 RepID=UPI0008326EC4|nr:phage GP46 family protein [Snodgrassella sp. CFCC 13594]
MDRALDPSTGDYTGSTLDNLQNAVYIRLMTPLGDYWADPALGSLLHLIQREKDLTRVGMLARQYAQEALQPIVDDGRASEITITETQPHNGYLYLHIQIDTAAGEKYSYEHPVKVI